MSKPNIERTIDVPGDLIKELLTDSELRMIKQRLLIINLLEEGLSIRAIAERAQVGTDTVVRVSKKLESNPKIRQFLAKPPANISKWVFGQEGTKE